tara:strand:- start:11964 stop:12434 length:471 start_codon:yes stop_codon:yes gene_type:complete
MKMVNLIPKTNNNYRTCNKNIDKYNKMIMSKPMIVKFHSPECPHCVAMKKSWNDVPKKLKELGYNTNNLNLASVDTEVLENENINGWQDIYGIPTIANINGNSVNVLDKKPTTMNIIHFIVEEYKLPKKKAKTLKRRFSRRSKSRRKKQTEHSIYQ